MSTGSNSDAKNLTLMGLALSACTQGVSCTRYMRCHCAVMASKTSFDAGNGTHCMLGLAICLVTGTTKMASSTICSVYKTSDLLTAFLLLILQAVYAAGCTCGHKEGKLDSNRSTAFD